MRTTRKIPKIKQLVIFCGGLGSRLGKITKKVPKPLLKINKKPFIEHILSNFSRFGITNAIFLCSYKFNQFQKKYDKKIIYGIKISCLNEGFPKGTAGALLHAKDKLDESFFLCNGDTYFDINILELANTINNKSLISIAIKEKKKNQRYSSLILNSKNYVTDFNIKKDINEKTLINGGVYYVKKKLISLINKNFFSLENEVFPIIAQSNKINGKVFNNSFLDIGVKKDLNKAKEFINRAKKKPAVFLDRDGVINKDLGYVYKYKNFIWMRNIKRLIKLSNDNNYYVFVVSNQSGIGRGYYKNSDLKILNSKINNELRMIGANIDDFFHAPYYEKSILYDFTKKDFLDRKPNIGMFLKCIKKWNIDVKKSIILGDKETDMIFAKKAKIKNRIFCTKDINVYSAFLKFINIINGK